jgi:broad specificity phosphatase PhoE
VPATTDPAAIANADVVLLRHGETTYNARNALSGDPSLPVDLSERGREQARAVAPLLAGVPWRSVWTTRFVRTKETLRELLPALAVEPRVLADLDDIDVGEFEGRHREEYRSWRRHHGVADAPPGGEARLDAVERYARGLRQLAREPHPTLVVTHDQPIRYLENALLDEDPVFGPIGPVPNAVPYAYARAELERGADRLEAYVRQVRDEERADRTA